jgi:hypothetical protein
MQPTYLPWAGYFAMINYVDSFVLLDDVQYLRRSWQSRNRILLDGNEHYLTVSVKKHSQNTKINCILINDEHNWRDMHFKTLTQAYKKAPFADSILNILENILYDTNIKNLSDLNILIIKAIANKLCIKTPLTLSSELPFFNKRSSYLLDICQYLNADCYISPPGSKQYLEEDGLLLNDSKISLKIFNFECKEYPQIKSNNFISHLSIIDVIANIGFDKTKDYIHYE